MIKGVMGYYQWGALSILLFLKALARDVSKNVATHTTRKRGRTQDAGSRERVILVRGRQHMR